MDSSLLIALVFRTEYGYQLKLIKTLPHRLQYAPDRKRDWTSARIKAGVTALESDVILCSLENGLKDATAQGLAELIVASFSHNYHEDDETR